MGRHQPRRFRERREFRRNSKVNIEDHSGLRAISGPDFFWESFLPVFLVDVGELGELVAVSLVEAVRIMPGASGGDAEDGKTTFPCPGFDAFAEAKADLAISMTVFDHESTDEGVRR